MLVLRAVVIWQVMPWFKYLFVAERWWWMNLKTVVPIQDCWLASRRWLLLVLIFQSSDLWSVMTIGKQALDWVVVFFFYLTLSSTTSQVTSTTNRYLAHALALKSILDINVLNWSSVQSQYLHNSVDDTQRFTFLQLKTKANWNWQVCIKFFANIIHNAAMWGHREWCIWMALDVYSWRSKLIVSWIFYCQHLIDSIVSHPCPSWTVFHFNNTFYLRVCFSTNSSKKFLFVCLKIAPTHIWFVSGYATFSPDWSFVKYEDINKK